MTREEKAIKMLKSKMYGNTDTSYEWAETVRMAIKALEQEPKQVELEGDGYAHGTDEIVYDFGRCPNCGWIFEEGDKDWEEPYCCHCGQKLKWFDNEAESEE